VCASIALSRLWMGVFHRERIGVSNVLRSLTGLEEVFDAL